jgi:hypothetical protein
LPHAELAERSLGSGEMRVRIAAVVALALAVSPAFAADSIMPLEDAVEVRNIFLFNEMMLEECGRATGDGETFEAAWQHWSARNHNHRVVANKVLAHYNASFDREQHSEMNVVAIRMSLSDSGNAEIYCTLMGLAAYEGKLDLPETRRDLFDMLVVSERVLREQGQ